ncbi:MAG: hypothetical protein AB7O43_05750 [Hyphomicrobiaceae bacterium]
MTIVTGIVVAALAILDPVDAISIQQPVTRSALYALELLIVFGFVALLVTGLRVHGGADS